MIPHTESPRQPISLALATAASPSWQQALADVIRDPAELFEILQLDPQLLAAAQAACQDFPLRVPRSFVARMQPGARFDPLLMQVLPIGQELDLQPGFSHDPLQEADANPLPGLIHKYQGRVLLVVSGGCAINCRYCFRRHFPYQDNNPGRQHWQQALDYIRADNSITEVIFSGGDPLAASDRVLAELAARIADIPHVTTLRIHSRLPVVIPQRINDDCLAWLTQPRLQTVLVLHANHANEIDSHVGRALQALKNAGVTLLNQTVLLKGINDDAPTLAALNRRLFAHGVLPYYLHMLDRVQGAAHFDVTQSRARDIIHQLLAELPGYLVPKLVRETPRAQSKVPIALGPMDTL